MAGAPKAAAATAASIRRFISNLHLHSYDGASVARRYDDSSKMDSCRGEMLSPQARILRLLALRGTGWAAQSFAGAPIRTRSFTKSWRELTCRQGRDQLDLAISPDRSAPPWRCAWRETHDMPTSRQDLIDALSKMAEGDKLAFEAVYAATCVKLYGVVVRILGRRDLAEEVLQEVYVRVWQRAGEFDPTRSSPITWMVAIARNRALDEAKRKTMRALDDMP